MRPGDDLVLGQGDRVDALDQRHDAADVLVLPARASWPSSRAQRRVVRRHPGWSRRAPRRRPDPRSGSARPCATGSIVGVVGTVTAPVNLRVSSDSGVWMRLSRMAGLTMSTAGVGAGVADVAAAVTVVVDEGRIGGRRGSCPARRRGRRRRRRASRRRPGSRCRRRRSPRCRSRRRAARHETRVRLAVVGAAVPARRRRRSRRRRRRRPRRGTAPCSAGPRRAGQGLLAPSQKSAASQLPATGRQSLVVGEMFSTGQSWSMPSQ